MKRILSLGIALVFFGLAVAARDGFSADWYEIARYRLYHDNQGNVRGIYYDPCSGDPQAATIVEGDITGTPTIREQWMCDPVTLQTPNACLFWENLGGTWYQIIAPCE